jgi:GNAT superfamily N-acetyltransferase
MKVVVRKAGPGDGATLHAMVKALAIHHGYESEFKAHPQDFEAALSVPGSVVSAILAEADGMPAGCAIFHRSFSTFRGRETMYLEDLSVLPQFRRRGIAKALMKAVAQEAVHRGVPSVSWLMMGWNKEARSLYEALGAEVEGDNCFCRLHGDELKRLAE